MPRLARLVIPDVALHVVQRGHDRKACFSHDTDRLVYLSTLRDLLPKSGCALHAFCLMTNHVHLLITPCDVSGPAKLMRDLGQRYVQYFNLRYERRGTLWEGRYYSCLVDSAAYVPACHRHIERNRLRAGMVPSVLHYRWSSYAANAGLAESNLLAPHPEYVALAEGEQATRGISEPARSGRRIVILGADTRRNERRFRPARHAAESEASRRDGSTPGRRKPGPPPAVGKQEADLLSEELGLCPRTN
jgi:putative transposase